MDEETKVSQDPIAINKDETNHSRGEKQIEIHPLVLINIADHYTRLIANLQYEKNNKLINSTVLQSTQLNANIPQAIGILFGIQNGLGVDVRDCFELKWELVNEEIVLDKDFVLSRIEQFAQVFPGFELLGWYRVGSKVLQSDLSIHRAIMEFNESPLFVLLDPTSNGLSTKKKLPITLFESELHMLNGVPVRILVKTPFKIEASETESISVDHISKIAPIGDTSKSSLHPYLGNVRDALSMLNRQVNVLLTFLKATRDGTIPMDHNLLRQISSICNQLPAISSKHFDAAFSEEYNDALLVAYLATLTKGATDANIILDRFALTQDKNPRRQDQF